MRKRVISTILAIIMAINLMPILNISAATTKFFAYDGYTIEYIIWSSWTGGGQDVAVKIHNTGTEPLEYWSFKYRPNAVIQSIWEVDVHLQKDDYIIVKAKDYNAVIQPGQIASFGCTLSGAGSTPDSFVYCTERQEKTSGYDVTFNPGSPWGDSSKSYFYGYLNINNHTNEKITGWELTFTSSFDILYDNNFIGGNGSYSYKGNTNGYTHFVNANDSRAIGFNGEFTGTAELLGYSLTECVIVDKPLPDAPQPPKPPAVTEEVESILLYGEYDQSSEQVYLTWVSDTMTSYYHTVLDGSVNGGGSDGACDFGLKYDGQEHRIYIVDSTWNSTKNYSNMVMLSPNDYGSYDVVNIDTDGDGIADFHELQLGTDREKADTDGDGLSDYEEIYITYTDPLIGDTDGNGITDDMEDFDEDGLTSLEEIRLGTSPYNNDSDGDGLSDWDEVNVYLTDPANSDTDSDGILDGDELRFELDPLNPETKPGTPDSRRYFFQNIESASLEKFNEDNDFSLSIRVSASGAADKNFTVRESGFSYASESNKNIIGKTLFTSYNEKLSVKSATYTFTLSDELVNRPSNNQSISDLQGLDRYAVFCYSDELGMMYPIAAEYDYANNAIIVENRKLGDYYIMDMDGWLYELGAELVEDTKPAVRAMSFAAVDYFEEISYTEEEGFLWSSSDFIPMAEDTEDFFDEEKKLTPAEVNELFTFDIFDDEAAQWIDEAAPPAIQAFGMLGSFAAPVVHSVTITDPIAPVDVVFMVDCSDNLMDNFENVRAQIIHAGNRIFEACADARIAIIGYRGSVSVKLGGWASTSAQLAATAASLEQTAVDNSIFGYALDDCINMSYRDNAERFAFLIFDKVNEYDLLGDFNYAQHAADIVNKSIRLSVLYKPGWTYLAEKSTELIEISGGYDGSNQGAFGEEVFGFVYGNTEKIIEEAINEDDIIRLEYTDDTVLYTNGFKKALLVELEAELVYYPPEWRESAAKSGVKFSDTDRDGLLDIDEVDFEKIKEYTGVNNAAGYRLPSMNDIYLYGIETYSMDISSKHFVLVESLRVLPIYSNPMDRDSDGDALNDYEEQLCGTKPLNKDTDEDGILDGDDLNPTKPYVQSLFAIWRDASEATMLDLSAKNNYDDNTKYDMPYPDPAFITGQGYNVVKDMTFGGTKVSTTGCGSISIYNTSKALGRHRDLSSIIYEFDLNPFSKTASLLSLTAAITGAVGVIAGLGPWNGFWGANPLGVNAYLSYHDFKPEMTWDLDEFKSWAKEDRVFIVLYLHGSGAHYVMLQADEKGTYTTYNRLTDHTEVYHGVDLDITILDNGNKIFLCGYYIPKVG